MTNSKSTMPCLLIGAMDITEITYTFITRSNNKNVSNDRSKIFKAYSRKTIDSAIKFCDDQSITYHWSHIMSSLGIHLHTHK